MSFVHLSEPIPNLIKEQLHVGQIGVNIFFIKKIYHNFNDESAGSTSGSNTGTVSKRFWGLGCIFICNWGMTEIGPITINYTFNNLDEVSNLKKRSIDQMTIMGNQFYCNWKIIDNELIVKSDQCVYKNWFNTSDLVRLNSHNELYYNKRK